MSKINVLQIFSIYSGFILSLDLKNKVILGFIY